MDGGWNQGHHCLTRTDLLITAVGTIAAVWRSRGISYEGHQQLQVVNNNIIIISATYVTGNSSRYFMGPSDTIWPRTVFSVRDRSFVIFARFTEDYGLKSPTNLHCVSHVFDKLTCRQKLSWKQSFITLSKSKYFFIKIEMHVALIH